ncbi:hypothetical protein AGLY_004556 [Aphis glycines]|uniref:Uncharacterized protein n=1 Tax=Aphis glycines TaxID=307491 RepID=A0A6G0TZB1_APHGL|nr:hypothetical protein AGLY_004556 [Aphis glycines]
MTSCELINEYCMNIRVEFTFCSRIWKSTCRFSHDFDLESLAHTLLNSPFTRRLVDVRDPLYFLNVGPQFPKGDLERLRIDEDRAWCVCSGGWSNFNRICVSMPTTLFLTTSAFHKACSHSSACLKLSQSFLEHVETPQRRHYNRLAKNIFYPITLIFMQQTLYKKSQQFENSKNKNLIQYIIKEKMEVNMLVSFQLNIAISNKFKLVESYFHLFRIADKMFHFTTEINALSLELITTFLYTTNKKYLIIRITITMDLFKTQMASLLSHAHALYVEMRQRYQLNFCGKDRSNHYYFVQQTLIVSNNIDNKESKTEYLIIDYVPTSRHFRNKKLPHKTF